MEKQRSTMPVHRHLDDELKVLRDLIFEMFDRVDEQFADAINALLNRDVELADIVRSRDDIIDALELKIDWQCERILARFQPVAADLRMIITAIKVNTDLERIGDHCKNLAKNTRHVVHTPEPLKVTRFQEMVDISRRMLREVQDAFIQGDIRLARRVLLEDKEIDELHRENFCALVNYCKEHPDHAEAVAHLLTASKALERISDHVQNIAEGVVFLIEGVDIRHRKLRYEPEA